jgi:tetratricopeptide (TPR) repeat protein
MNDLLEKAEERIAADELESAVVLLTLSLKTCPQGWAFYRRGYVYFRLDDFDKAIDDLTKSLDTCELSEATDGMARYFRGFCYAAQRNYSLALGDAWSLFEAAKKESELMDDGCDVVDAVIQKMKQDGRVVAESAAVRQILMHLIQNVFAKTDHGLIWASQYLDWLDSSSDA